MNTRVDESIARAPEDLCFRIARDIERWPIILPHYRWVRFQRRDGPGRGSVEMAAWRVFLGPLRYPTWWVSEMRSDETALTIDYEHLAGITRGMTVRWEILPAGVETLMRISHSWDGPRWPLVQEPAWTRLIGPHFVSYIARRTLAGIAVEAERQTHASYTI